MSSSVTDLRRVVPAGSLQTPGADPSFPGVVANQTEYQGRFLRSLPAEDARFPPHLWEDPCMTGLPQQQIIVGMGPDPTSTSNTSRPLLRQLWQDMPSNYG